MPTKSQPGNPCPCYRGARPEWKAAYIPPGFDACHLYVDDRGEVCCGARLPMSAEPRGWSDLGPIAVWGGVFIPDAGRFVCEYAPSRRGTS